MELIFAYIDPGSGSLVIQALIAGVVAIPIFFRNHIRRIVRSVRKDDTSSPETPGTGPDDATGRG